MKADFLDLWTEDVVEVFLWPDETCAVYIEYEISPMNYELAIMVSNQKGDLVRWQPFHYDKDRQTRHATHIEVDKRKKWVKGWRAEFFLPYKLLRPLSMVPPSSGSIWRENFFRVDYDEKEVEVWAWKATGESFHEYQRFGHLYFE